MKNKEQQIESYTKTGKLLSPKLPCTKCQTDVTLFGDNLKKRIAKYGNLETLLDTFTCRSCGNVDKPKKEKKTVVKQEKKEKEEIVYNVPKMKFSEKRNVFLKDAPDIIQSMTNFACASPAYYLDHARSCNGCVYSAHCNCPLKKLAA